MAVGTGREMVRRNDVTVKVDAEVARLGKVVAAYRDVSLAEYLSDVLRPIVERDLREHSRESLGEGGPKPKPKGKP